MGISEGGGQKFTQTPLATVERSILQFLGTQTRDCTAFGSPSLAIMVEFPLGALLGSIASGYVHFFMYVPIQNPCLFLSNAQSLLLTYVGLLGCLSGGYGTPQTSFCRSRPT